MSHANHANEEQSQEQNWRKVLYGQSASAAGYPANDRIVYSDNFTPRHSFLAAIQRNKDLKLYSRSDCLHGAAVVGREISLVVTFWSLYIYLSEGLISCEQLLSALLLVISAGYLYHLRNFSLSIIFGRVKTTFLFVTIGYALSPVLYKLTDTISTDTIHSMSVAGLVVHIITHHYGITGPIVSKSISLNSAIFAAVCLASRFPTHTAAFSLLCLAVFSFLLVPMWSEVYVPNPVKSLLSALVSVSLLARVMPSYAVLAALLLILVQVVCPLLFHKLQAHKQTIHGPWDEASLH